MTKKTTAKRNEIVLTIFDKLPDADFAQITIKDMCSAANISVGTFYHYFKDKSSFFLQIYSLLDEYLKEELAPILTDENEINNLVQFCIGYARYTSNDFGARILKVAFESLPSLSTENRERPFYSILREILRKAQEKKQISQTLDINEITKTLIIILRGHSFDWAWHEGNYDLVESIECFITLFVKSLCFS